jgi:hypothetical protein
MKRCLLSLKILVQYRTRIIGFKFIVSRYLNQSAPLFYLSFDRQTSSSYDLLSCNTQVKIHIINNIYIGKRSFKLWFFWGDSKAHRWDYFFPLGILTHHQARRIYHPYTFLDRPLRHIPQHLHCSRCGCLSSTM